jgi:hypothetical protein
MRDRYFLIFAVLIYITPAFVYCVSTVVSAALSSKVSGRSWEGWFLILLFYLFVTPSLLISPYYFTLLPYPYGVIFAILYYAISYGLLYSYWRRHVASVERAKLFRKSQAPT